MKLDLNNADEVAEALVNVRATAARMAQTPTREDVASKLSVNMSEAAARIEAVRLASSRNTKDKEALAAIVGQIDSERKEQIGTLQDASVALEHRLKELEVERVNAIVAPAETFNAPPVERPPTINPQPVTLPIMSTSNSLLTSFKVTVNSSSQTSVDVKTGSWIQGDVSASDSATGIGSPANKYIKVTADISDGVLASITVGAFATATQSSTVVLLAELEYTDDNSRIQKITVHHVGDIHQSTGGADLINLWCAFGVDCVSSIESLSTASYVEQVCWPTSGAFALKAGAMWVAVAYPGYLVHYQLCLPLEE